MRADLDRLQPFKDHQVSGILEGEGILHWSGVLESDFDLNASFLKVDGWSVENKNLLHAYYSSKKGIAIRGLNVAISSLSQDAAECKIGLFQYDLEQSLFTLTQVQFHLFQDFYSLKSLGLQILHFLLTYHLVLFA